jgi:hypothetical protein
MKQKEKLIVFTLHNEIICSSLRFKVLQSTSFGCDLKSFELFGEIIQQNSSLQTLLSKPIKMEIGTPIKFDFSEESIIGLFYFFEKVSLKDRNEVFEILSYDSKPHSTSQSLLFWNEEEWQAEILWGVYLYLSFKFPFVFQISGYRFKSGKGNFVKSWTVEGIQSEHGKTEGKETILDEQKENRDLSRSGAERSFRINSETFFDRFLFDLKENSEGRREFSLAGLEIFGVLTKVQ